MKQLIGIEYQEPEEVVVTITQDGIRININDRCVFVVLKAKILTIRDTRKNESSQST